MADAHTANPALNTYQFDLTGAGRSDITIVVEAIPFRTGGYRPIQLTGLVQKPVLTPGRDTSLLPLSMNDDEEAWDLLKEASFEGGHLVGLAFGGPDHEMNIAPMNKGANSGSGSWGAIEKELRAHCSAQGRGETVRIEVNLSYGGATDPRIPVRVAGRVWRQTALGGTVAATVIDIGVRPPSDRTNCLTRPMITLFRDIQQAAETKGYATLQPSQEQPNAPLDVVDYKNDPLSRALRVRIRQAHPLLADYPLEGFRKKARQAARAQQRTLMFFYNRFRNKIGPQGTALLTAEDTKNLGLLLREWEAQHDHTLPKARGGSNHYRNLVLTHHRSNNRKGATGSLIRKKRNRRRPIRYGYDT